MNNDGKIEYEPTHTKRFEISKDSYSRERLKAIVDTTKELRARYSFVVGTTIFGSLSKGKSLDAQSAERSDIDVIIFINEHQALENFEKLEEENDDAFADALQADIVVEGLQTQTSDNNILTIAAVATPWLLDIGGGLSKYRKAYLHQLQSLDKDERDLRWQATIAAVRFYERKSVIPENIQKQYPTTYKEAIKYYGV